MNLENFEVYNDDETEEESKQKKEVQNIHHSLNFKSIIKKFFYPIFPPDKHVYEIIKWLKKN